MPRTHRMWLLALALASTSFAVGLAQATTQTIELGQALEDLGGASDLAQARTLRIQHAASSGVIWHAALAQEQRFALQDRQWSVGAAWPITPRLGLELEVSHSATAKVLARNSVLATLHAAAGAGWELRAGLKANRYTTGPNQLLVLGVAQESRTWRGDYTAYLARTADGRHGLVHRLTLNWNGSDAFTLAASVSGGREAEYQGASAGTRFNALRGMALNGRVALGPGWSLGWGLWQQQRDLLEPRKGLHVSLQCRF